MKPLKLHRLAAALLFLIILIAIVAAFTGCNATKKVSTTKQTYDSSTINILKDSVRNLKKEVQTLKQTISEKGSVDVVFDNTVCPPCPEVNIPKDLNTIGNDSLINLVANLNDAIAFYNSYSKGLENKVKIFADGSKEYSGKLKSYKQSDEKKQEIINNLIRESDSLRDVFQQNNTTVAKVDEKKDVDKKTSVLNWWHFLIIGFIGGGLVCVTLDRKTKIFKIFG